MKWFVVISFMGIGASWILGVQSPASGIEKQISYYNQATCRAFCLVSPSEKYQQFHTGLRNQFPEKIFVDVSFVISCRFDREKIVWSCSKWEISMGSVFLLVAAPTPPQSPLRGVFTSPQEKQTWWKTDLEVPREEKLEIDLLQALISSCSCTSCGCCLWFQRRGQRPRLHSKLFVIK